MDKIHSAYEEAQGAEGLEEDMTSNADVENIAASLKIPCFSHHMSTPKTTICPLQKF